jgi:hypothetical protein
MHRPYSGVVKKARTAPHFLADKLFSDTGLLPGIVRDCAIDESDTVKANASNAWAIYPKTGKERYPFSSLAVSQECLGNQMPAIPTGK